MPDSQEAQELEELLAIHRSVVEKSLKQIWAQGGKKQAQQALNYNLSEARVDIALIKQWLRGRSFAVEDKLFDQQSKLDDLPYDKVLELSPEKDRKNRKIFVQHLRSGYQKILKRSTPAINLSFVGSLDESQDGSVVQHSLFDYFYKYKQQFVLLGPTGSGKSILLTQLALDLLEEASQDEGKPIPVLFSLASWRPKQSLQDWMARNLAGRLNTSPAQIKRFFDADLILPLFDDLDKIVDFQTRLDCAREVQAYQKNSPDLRHPMVLACREDTYRALDGFQLNAEVYIQVLSYSEIHSYLHTQNCSILLALLDRQENLRTLAQSPFFLYILARDYTDLKINQSFRFSERDISQELLANYLQERFRAAHCREHPIEEMQAFLGWLAATMNKQGNLQHFYLETLDGSWLPSKVWRISFLALKLLIFSLLGLSAIGLVYLVIGLLGLWLGFSWTLLGAGIALGLLLWLRLELEDNLVTERLDWSLRALRIEISTALKAGTITGLLASVAGLGFLPPLPALGFGMSAGLGIGFAMLLPHGLIREEQPAARKPNQRIINSLHNALLAWLIYALYSAVWIGLLSGIVVGLAYGWAIGLVSGAITGVVIGGLIGFFAGMLRYGGLAYLQHYLLRSLLTLSTPAPLRLLTWLQLAQQHELLIESEGGYRFQHELIQQQMAQLGQGPSQAPKEQEAQTEASPA